jgi:hypothetical protein
VRSRLQAETRDKHVPSDPDCPPASICKRGARPYEPPRLAEGPRVRQQPSLARPSRSFQLKRETNACRLTRTAPPRAFCKRGGEAVRAPRLAEGPRVRRTTVTGLPYARLPSQSGAHGFKLKRGTNTCRLTRTAPRELCKRGGEAVRAPPLGGRSPGYEQQPLLLHGLPPRLLPAETRDKRLPSDPDCPPVREHHASGGRGRDEPPRLAEGPGYDKNRYWLPTGLPPLTASS